MSRILIDGRFVGIGDSQTRLVLELVRNILKIDKNNHYTLVIRPAGIKELPFFFDINKPLIEKLTSSLKLEIENLDIVILDIPHYSLAEQTKFLSYLNREKFDLVHFVQFNHPILYLGKYIATIQDLTLIGHLHYFNFIKQLAYNMVMKSAIYDSAKIIAISQNTVKEIQEFSKVETEKITVIYHGIDHERFNTGTSNLEIKIQQFKKKYNIKGDYLLYTGMWKKHKNLLRLFGAFEQFLNSNFQGSESKQELTQLVLTGKIDTKEPAVVAEIERINKEFAARGWQSNPILTTGFIDDDELPTAYAGALAYVIPSLSEGFGWPPLEAMACGTPVIASNASCIPEILGDAPYYFDPENVEDMADSIQKIVTDDKLRQELTNKGLNQVQKYDWAKTARKTFEIYEELLENKA